MYANMKVYHCQFCPTSRTDRLKRLCGGSAACVGIFVALHKICKVIIGASGVTELGFIEQTWANREMLWLFHSYHDCRTSPIVWDIADVGCLE